MTAHRPKFWTAAIDSVWSEAQKRGGNEVDASTPSDGAGAVAVAGRLHWIDQWFDGPCGPGVVTHFTIDTTIGTADADAERPLRL